MTKPLTKSLLETHAERFDKRVEKVTEGVYSAIGYALSNSILITTNAGNIIVDTTESVEAATEIKQEFQAISDKEIIAIIYTHGHHDHTHGTTAFLEKNTKVYANEKILDLFQAQYSQLEPIITKRSLRQFAYGVSDHLMPCSGLGPKFKWNASNPPTLIYPTETFKDRLTLHFDSITLELVSAPGETDDHIYIWIPEKKVLLSGDNYYPTFPNLYSLRGTPPRPVQQWIESIDQMRDLQPEFLVPSHSEPLYGEEKVQEHLQFYRDAIQYVHDSVVQGMNKGRTPDELANNIKLPEPLAAKKELLELYGDISQSVRAIYYGYLGWFDGNATNLHPLPHSTRAKKIIHLSGGTEKVFEELNRAFDQEEYQWAAELADMLLENDSSWTQVKKIKAKALYQLGILSQNSNNRGYYLSQANELAGTSTFPVSRRAQSKKYIETVPTEQFFANLSVSLNQKESRNKNISANIRLPDENTSYLVHIRNEIAEIRKGELTQPQLELTMNSQLWKEIVSRVKHPKEEIEAGRMQLKGEIGTLITLLSLFNE